MSERRHELFVQRWHYSALLSPISNTGSIPLGHRGKFCSADQMTDLLEWISSKDHFFSYLHTCKVKERDREMRHREIVVFTIPVHGETDPKQCLERINSHSRSDNFLSGKQFPVKSTVLEIMWIVWWSIHHKDADLFGKISVSMGLFPSTTSHFTPLQVSNWKHKVAAFAYVVVTPRLFKPPRCAATASILTNPCYRLEEMQDLYWWYCLAGGMLTPLGMWYCFLHFQFSSKMLNL